jgi:hypothetical protein
MLYAFFVNGLAEDIAASGLGVSISDGDLLESILFADDMTLIAPSEANLRELLHITARYADKALLAKY